MGEVPMYSFISAGCATVCRTLGSPYIVTGTARYRGASLMGNCPAPQDHNRTLGTALL